jgi:hypothetical protein
LLVRYSPDLILVNRRIVFRGGLGPNGEIGVFEVEAFLLERLIVHPPQIRALKKTKVDRTHCGRVLDHAWSPYLVHAFEETTLS